eukprot:GDKJ01037376.1.p3 GENE.GDKJ01037376.1~~GDKJ01037376.1.p3  ORF type:complete len:101 (-),score=8.97 GDKJ01037376.1:320-622(-)
MSWQAQRRPAQASTSRCSESASIALLKDDRLHHQTHQRQVVRHSDYSLGLKSTDFRTLTLVSHTVWRCNFGHFGEYRKGFDHLLLVLLGILLLLTFVLVE